MARPGSEASRVPPLLLAASALALLTVLALRLRFLDLPLERDEGEYALGGQLLLRGGVLFRDLYTLKFPGAHAAFAAVFWVFGETARAVRLGLLLFNAATATSLFFLGRRLFGSLAAVVTVVTFVLLSASLSVSGLFAHATQLLVLPMVGGLLALHVGLGSERPLRWLALSGLLLGAAVLVKQHAVVFLLFGGWVALRQGWRSAAVLLAGAGVPLLLLAVALLSAGSFDAFWFWCFDYARRYVGMNPLGEGLREAASRLGKIAAASPALIALTIWGAWTRLRGPFLGGWLLASIASVCPGFYFREHYFVPLVPVAAVLAGAGAIDLAGRARALLPAVLVFATLYPLAHDHAFLLEQDRWVAMHRLFGRNTFPEAVEVARYLRGAAAPGDRVQVLGSEPEVSFLSGLPPATGYIYVYGLMERHPLARAMQEDFIRRLAAFPPRWIVYASAPPSWLRRPDSEVLLHRWLPPWLRDHYEIVGVADVLEHETRYVWDGAARSYRPQSALFMVVQRRRD